MLHTVILILVALIPTQLGLHFWPPWSFVYGLSIDYLSPTVYLTDVFLFLLLLLNYHRFFSFFQHFKLISLLLLFNLIFSQNPLNSTVFIFRILLLINFALVISVTNKKNIINIVTVLLFSTFLASLIALGQFLAQSSLNGPLYFLGERHFDLTTPGIAKATPPFINRTFLRPYSTFSHPNSLAGFIAVLIPLFLPLRRHIPVNKKTFSLSLVTLIITLLLTYSRTALLALMVTFPLVAYRKTNLFKYYLPLPVLITLIFLLPASQGFDSSYTVRHFLNLSALQIIISQPLFGVGFNNFIPALSQIKPLLDHYLLQPVHNIYLLLLAEFGILSTTIISSGLMRVKPNKLVIASLFVIAITGSLDHYWLTLNQNRLLLALIFGLAHNHCSSLS